MKIKTSQLRTMVNVVSKINPSKTELLTEYYHLVINKSGMKLTAYDSKNWITVVDKSVKLKGKAANEIDVIIKGDKFTKLIQKTSVEEINITLKDSYLELKANGTYKVPILLHEEYKTIDEKIISSFTDDKTFSTTDFKNAYEYTKHTVSTDTRDQYLTGFLFNNEQLQSTDGYKVCSAPLRSIIADKEENTPILFTKELMSLISAIPDEEFNISYKDEKVLITSKSIEIYGPTLYGVDEYPNLDSIIGVEQNSNLCKVSKSLLVAALDRLSLFITSFDRNFVTLTFDKNSLEIKTENGSCETIPCEITGEKGVIHVQIDNLKSIASLIVGDSAELKYGSELTLEIACGEVKLVIALAVSEEESEV